MKIKIVKDAVVGGKLLKAGQEYDWPRALAGHLLDNELAEEAGSQRPPPVPPADPTKAEESGQ